MRIEAGSELLAPELELRERAAAGKERDPRFDAIRPERQWRTMLALGVPCLVAAVLCALELSARSLWLDEGASVSIASQHGAALWHAFARDGGNMIAYYALLHA